MINHRTARVTIVALAVASLGIAACSTNSNSDTATPAASPTMSSAPLWAPPGSGDLSAQTADELQAAIDKWVAQGSLTGMTAAVVTPDGVWSGAAGVDGAGTPLQPDSALSLQSISKTYTAAEVMLLAGRGLVDLDAPITDYVDVPFDTQGATVRQVLAMRSGFPDYTDRGSPRRRSPRTSTGSGPSARRWPPCPRTQKGWAPSAARRATTTSTTNCSPSWSRRSPTSRSRRRCARTCSTRLVCNAPGCRPVRPRPRR